MSSVLFNKENNKTPFSKQRDVIAYRLLANTRKIAIMRVLMLVLILFVISCSNKQAEKEYSSVDEKEQNLKILADSTVNLSFSGITLGMPLKETMEKATKDSKVWNVEYNKDKVVTCKANIYLQKREEPLVVDVGIASFQDTITSFMITSEDYDTHSELIELYDTKYQQKYASFEDQAGIWDEEERVGSSSSLWTFKNQTLRVSNFYREERELYVKNEKMRSPENRYDVKSTKYFKAVVIIYSDLKQCEKVRIAEAEEEKRLQEKKRAEQAEQEKQLEQQNNRALQQEL